MNSSVGEIVGRQRTLLGWYPSTLLLLSLNISEEQGVGPGGYLVCHFTATRLLKLLLAENDAKGLLDVFQQFLGTDLFLMLPVAGPAMGTFVLQSSDAL